MGSLAVEFGAARLLAPFFGTSLYVWGVLIGLVLIYLSAGYVIGGRLADRRPDEMLLYQITAWAGLWIGVILLVSYPILLASQQGFRELSIGLVGGTLLGVMLLFALPVFWFIPTYGTRPTLEAFGLVLVLFSVAAMWPRKRFYAAFAILVILAWIFLPSGIKPPEAGTLLTERESAYNYIQVVQSGTVTELILNEGQAIHSVYDSTDNLTHGYWDYLLVANAFQPAQPSATSPRSLAILGLAGGTTARQYRLAYGDSVDITGVEIDPAILAIGHQYFHLGDARAHEVTSDARYWIATQAGNYDVIVLDAYRQPYIPFHLTTKEFFAQVRQHLNPGGVAAVNVGRTSTDYRLVAAIASTMAAVYTNVFVIDDKSFNNTLVYGTTEKTTLDDIRHNLAQVSAPLASDAAQEALLPGRLLPSPYNGQVYTDDLAPVEQLIDEIIFSYVTGA